MSPRKGFVVAGILVKNCASSSSAKKKRLRDRARIIDQGQLNSSVEQVLECVDRIDTSIQEEKQAILHDYVRKEQFKDEFLLGLKQDIQKGLSFVHDYKQINTQIAQNINVIIELNRRGSTFEEKVENASEQERAIYHASKLLTEKLNVAKFLMQPSWLDNREECVSFRVHGLVHKYCKIYEPLFRVKEIERKFIGSSYAEVLGNPQAVSVIPHTFIDNAAKYSPKGGRVQIYLKDKQDGGVDLKVSSFGPRIRPEEADRIFEPFFRAEAAKRQEEEGAGYGLYVSQLVAERHLGTRINVVQEEQQKPRMGHWTTFSVVIPDRAAILF